MISAVLLLLCTGCNKDDSVAAAPVLTNFEYFSLDLPDSWAVLDYPVEEIGGLLSNGVDSVYYDYGPWAYAGISDLDLHLIDTLEHLTLEINNERALILVGQRSGEDRITYNYLIDKEDGFNHIRYIAYDLDDDSEIREFIMTHRFL